MIFWSIAGLMLGLVVLVLAWSVLRQRERIVDEVKARNLRVAREKLKELEADLAAGNLDQAAFEQAKEELELELLEDTSGPQREVAVTAQGKRAALVLLGLVPVASLGLYFWLGEPAIATGSRSVHQRSMAGDPHAEGGKAPTMAEIVATLEQQVQKQPDDAETWFMLGRVYASLKRFDKAAEAYGKVAELTDRHPQALIAWADSLAMTQGGRLSGKPYALVKEALEKAPDDTTALWLAGQGASEVGDFQNAVYYWRQAEAGLADQPEYVQELRGLIAQVKQAAEAKGMKLDDPGSAVELKSVAKAGIELKVSISPELKTKVKPDEPLFIFAKAVQGPPMPVAAVRMTAGELPKTVRITDDDLLRGGHLKDYAQLKVAARIARSGQPMAASGDLQSAEVVVKPGDGKPVALVIDQVVP